MVRAGGISAGSSSMAIPQLIIRRPLWSPARPAARTRRALLLLLSSSLSYCHHPRSLSLCGLPIKTRFLASRYTLVYGHSYTTTAAAAAAAAAAVTALRESMASAEGPKDMFVELTAPNGRRYTQPLGLFINGEWVAAKSGEKITSINPTDESEIASVHAAGPEDVDLAVEAARAAFADPSWHDLSTSARGDLLLRLAQLVQEHAETLATIETWDNGKPYLVALNSDVAEVASTLKYYAGWADKVHGQVIDTEANKLVYTTREPVGVCGMIIPWNYPLLMAACKLGPALACGNTLVIKAAEQTPLSILYLATLIERAGFPRGVINILNGRGPVAGAAIARHADVSKLSFTGSTATGREVMRMAAGTLKGITLETGGKSALLVFDDADVALAARWSHAGIMANAGQVCCATSRVLVHARVYDRFVALFRARVRRVSKLGDPFAADTYQGPQVSRAQYERVRAYIDSGVADGATVDIGGSGDGDDLQDNRNGDTPGKTAGSSTSNGYFVQPTIFTNVRENMQIYREEIFGPVVVISSFGEPQRASNDAANANSQTATTSTTATAITTAAANLAATAAAAAANGNQGEEGHAQNGRGSKEVDGEDEGAAAAARRQRDEDEAVRRANDSHYGLAAAVFTRDVARAHRVARRLEAGTVWLNSSNDGDYRVPFGGVKQSGIGRELGEAGLAAYSNLKAVHVNLAA